MTQNIAVADKTETPVLNAELMQIIGGTLLIALLSQIQIPLPFTPVPLSLQTFAVMLVGGIIGSKNGAIATILYLAQIAWGFPVTAGGGVNPLALIGPSGGYLIGMVMQAYLVGWLFERRAEFSPWKLFFGTLAVSFVQMGIGTVWLAQFVGWSHAPVMGFFPFVPGDILKVTAAVTLSKKVKNTFFPG